VVVAGEEVRQKERSRRSRENAETLLPSYDPVTTSGDDVKTL
jgi:hypothetical protein